METTNEVISDLSRRRNKIVTGETIFILIGKAIECVLQTLSRDIPSYLLAMLYACIVQVRHWKKLVKFGRKLEDVEHKVYDLGNCGPRNRFMVGNLIVHNCQYGAGAGKIHKTLTMNGVDISFSEVQEIYNGYWELYGGIRKMQRKLEDQWRVNKGFILNGIGRPIGVYKDMTKDLFNRVCQSTGHDLLVIYVHEVCQTLERLGIPYTPFIIDFHDAITLEVPEKFGGNVAEVLERVVDHMNQTAGNKCPLGGKAVVGRNLAECKEPDR